MTLEDVSSQLESAFPEIAGTKVAFRGEISYTVAREKIVDVCQHCRDVLAFDYMTDLTGVDHFDVEPRFEVVYELYGLPHGNHLRLKVFAPEGDPAVPTVSHIWPTADWHEREAYDMLGITFPGHPDLRRILMWDGYPYFPLRKDFPLEGKPSEVPDVAFTRAAPLEGGPFVSVPSDGITKEREPRARHV